MIRQPSNNLHKKASSDRCDSTSVISRVENHHDKNRRGEQKVNIAILHSHLTKLNGAGHMITQIANGLAMCGHQVSVIAAVINDDLYEFDARVSLHSVSSSIPESPLFWITVPLLVRRMVKEIAKIRPDYVLANHFPSNWALVKSGCHGHWLCHEPYPYFYDYDMIERNRITQIGARAISLLYSRQDIKMARKTAILANSRFTQKSINKVFMQRSEVLHPGISSEVLNFNGSVPKDGSIISISPSKPLKRFEITVRTLAMLSKEFSKLRLKVVGPIWEPYRALIDTLNRTSRVEVKVLGTLPRTEYYEEIQKAQVVSFPSFEEPFGIVPLEAAGLGTPVVYFRSGGLLDSMIDGVTGIGVDEGDFQGFARAIRHILKHGIKIDLDSPELKAHFGEFTWNSVIRKLLNIIEAGRKQNGSTTRTEAQSHFRKPNVSDR